MILLVGLVHWNILPHLFQATGDSKKDYSTGRSILFIHVIIFMKYKSGSSSACFMLNDLYQSQHFQAHFCRFGHNHIKHPYQGKRILHKWKMRGKHVSKRKCIKQNAAFVLVDVIHIYKVINSRSLFTIKCT